jgi:predicted alpha/beta hydrolase
VSIAQPYDLLFQTSDGTAFSIALHGDDPARIRPVALLLPAMGVGARYYSLFARQLAAEGLTVALTDLRGQGASTPPAGRGTKHGFAEIVEIDIPQIVSMLRQRYPDRAVYVIGHSLGGQLGLLAHAHRADLFDALVLIASGSAWHRGQIGWRAPRHLIAGHVFAAISRVLGFWPGDVLGFGGRQSTQMMIDCARQASTGSYRLPTAAGDYETELGTVPTSVLFVEIDGDTLTPPASVDHLRSKLRCADISGLTLPGPVGTALGVHFAWVRHSPTVAVEVHAWLRSLAQRDGDDESGVAVLEDGAG